MMLFKATPFGAFVFFMLAPTLPAQSIPSSPATTSLTQSACPTGDPEQAKRAIAEAGLSPCQLLLLTLPYNWLYIGADSHSRLKRALPPDCGSETIAEVLKKGGYPKLGLVDMALHYSFAYDSPEVREGLAMVVERDDSSGQQTSEAVRVLALLHDTNKFDRLERAYWNRTRSMRPGILAGLIAFGTSSQSLLERIARQETDAGLKFGILSSLVKADNPWAVQEMMKPEYAFKVPNPRDDMRRRSYYIREVHLKDVRAAKAKGLTTHTRDASMIAVPDDYRPPYEQ